MDPLHQACTHHHTRITRLEPDPLIRWDILPAGWGCSILPTRSATFAGTQVPEIYGEGSDPLEAISAAADQLALLERRRHLVAV